MSVRRCASFVAVGICGGLTTFSTWMVESVLLTRDGHGGVAVLYLVVSLVAGFAAVAPGITGARRVLHRPALVFDPSRTTDARPGSRWPAPLGALGALRGARPVQSRAASRFPYGTVVVNVSGSFVLGLVVGLATYQGLDADVRTVVGTGFIGAYTTFSSFSYDTFGLFEDRASSRRAGQRVGERRASDSSRRPRGSRWRVL